MEEQPLVYPRHNIDPAKKNEEWCRLYAKAAWNDWNYTIPRTIFYNSADKYEELRLYAIGQQPINKYKKLMGVDEQTDNTWLNLDWAVRPIVPKFIEIALSRMMQQEYNIVATPIDPQAKAELDEYYSGLKAKIAVRQLMQQQNPELANHPMIQAQPGEPQDTEELEMRVDFGEQFNRARDAEQAIQLGFYWNGIKEHRKQVLRDNLIDGVSGYKEWLGADNKPKFRKTNNEAVVTNYCRFADFRDLIHAGEVIDVALVDLAALRDDEGNSVFTDEQLEEMRSSVAGKYSNPTMVGRSTNYFKGYDKFKVKVLDMEFFSYNELNFESNVNRKGNVQFNEAAYHKRNNVKDKYIRKRIKVVYKVKWIIGTDYAYDWGLVKDMKRSVDPKKKAETTLSYKFYAPNFYEMRTLSMMQRLMPLADDFQMTWMRIQNFLARTVPNGWWVDLDALENVALNKGGENMKPMDLLQMFFETGVLVGRSKDVMGDNVNYKPVIPIANNSFDELQAMYQHLQIVLQQMQSIIGLNDITDGSTPNPKMLNGVANLAVESTNNSLYQLQFAEKQLLEKLAEDVMIRMQQAVKKGGVEGYAPALNSNTLKFMQISPTIALREYGIMLEERPTDDQRQILMMQVQQDIANGMLDTSDALYILNVYNVKQAQMLLAYKVKKNKQAMHAQQMQMNQQTIEGQQQSAAMAEQMKQQTVQVQLQADLAKIEAQGQWDYKLKQLDGEIQLQKNQLDNQIKMAGKVLDNEVKERVAEQKADKPAA
jgi:hypothetical protein